MSNRQHLSGIKLKSKTFRLFFIVATFLFLPVSSTVSAESSDGYYNNGLNYYKLEQYEQTAKP
ncbi:hypothetical protein, partial [Sporomusa sp.]|uniref:hypothetical protein n=1 Tax=Sporomusa sp. TaxID=2078658 RepID=UPI002D10A683